MAYNLVDTYKSVFNQIDTITDNGLPVFQLRAIFNDQIRRALKSVKGYVGVDGYLIPTPSVFVEMQYRNETNLGLRINGVDITFIFHIVMQQFDAMDGTMDQNLEVFSLRDKIHNAFVGFFPAQCGAMRWRREFQQFNHTNYYEYIIEYEAHYIDQTAYKELQTISATLSITPGITGSFI